MNKYLNKSNLKFAWWFIFNLLTTLFVVSLIGFFGGTQGEDGLDGRDGSYIRDILTQNMLEKPTGTNRETYADNLIEEGFLPIDSLEDIETYFYDDLEEAGNYDFVDFLELRDFVLTADLDFSEATERQHIPLYYGESTFNFRGIFDGAGYTISGFESDSDQEYVGFFPQTEDAIIRNVTFYESFVSNASNNDESGYVGVVVGDASENLDLINVTVDSSTVQSLGRAGGFVGQTDDDVRIINSHILDSEVAGVYAAGGFVGDLDEGEVLIAYSSSVDSYINGYDVSEFSDVSDTDAEAGGFIGEIEWANYLYVYRSFNTSKVSSFNEEAGGFFGEIEMAYRIFIAQSYNAGLVQSFDDNAGGLIARVNLGNQLIIQDSFNIGTIYGDDSSGGLIGTIDREYRPSVSIINVYNAGNIFGFNDYFGGIIGDQDDNMVLTIQTSFSFTAFSPANFERNPFDPQNFPESGAVVGQAREVMFDQVYYYVEANNPRYAENATDIQYDFGTVAIEDEASFHEEDFVLNQSWDFQSIWEFTDAFDFPSLQDVEFLNPGEEMDDVAGLDLYANVQLTMLDVELGYTPFEFYFSEFWMGDLQDSVDDLTVEFGYASTSYDSYTEGDLELLLEEIEIFDSLTGYPLPGEVYEFTPINTSYNFFYVIVTDTDGNKFFQRVDEFEAQLRTDEDVIAPTTTDAQVNADFVENNINGITYTFQTATDNVNTHEELNYYVMISNSSESFLDVGTAWAMYSTGDFLYTRQILGSIPEGLFTRNSEVSNFEFNTEYFISIIVEDQAGNRFLYTYATIEIID